MATESTPALRALAGAGIRHEVRAYEPPAASARGERHAYGDEAAAALGVDAARIFRTLVALVDDLPVVAVVPVAGQLDLKALAAVLGGRRAILADPAVAERLSGSVVGGISPLGMRRALPTVVDESAAQFERVLVSAGRRGLQVELAPDDLVRAASARLAPIARPR